MIKLFFFDIIKYYGKYFVKVSAKIRSDKIMRRILKTIAAGTDIGNVTTLADPSVVDALLEERKKMDIEIG